MEIGSPGASLELSCYGLEMAHSLESLLASTTHGTDTVVAERMMMLTLRWRLACPCMMATLDGRRRNQGAAGEWQVEQNCKRV